MKTTLNEEANKLIMAFEEAFGVEIPDEDAQGIRKVKDAIKYITDKA